MYLKDQLGTPRVRAFAVCGLCAEHLSDVCGTSVELFVYLYPGEPGPFPVMNYHQELGTAIQGTNF